MERGTRDYLFDNIKVLLISSVVMAHFFRVSGFFDTGSLSRTIYTMIFLYLMQGFFFVSGYFSRNVDKCRQTAFKNFMIPYILFMVLFYFTRLLVFGNAHFDILQPTHGMWYLLAMFVYRYFIKDLEKVKYILPISLAAYFTAGFIPFLTETLALGRILSFLFFFMLGHSFTPEMIAKVRRVPKYISGPVLAALIWVSFHISSSDINIELLHIKTNYLEYGVSPMVCLISRIAVLLLSLAFLFVIINLMPNRQLAVSGVGRNTMTVYLFHIFIRYLIKDNSIYGGGSVVYYLIVFGVSVMTVYVFSRPFIADAYNRMIDSIYRYLVSIPKRKLFGRRETI